ncbi:phage holin, LLH family [Convivina praedatoris]|uniref:Uncharacterized protein n=1 Tax=Convivina praedatoris TaxID=2880963 RepID=A0ABN8HAW7_9LACO|nr:phage holin, LLH family [Convivina sp. LMG 32447]CAH1857311.1 hypothetical protein LMG032447_01494 [Convivina sp. LMG 32447]
MKITQLYELLVMLLALLGLFGPLIHAGISLIKKYSVNIEKVTKLHNVALVAGWFDDAVSALENTDMVGADKRQEAIERVKERLNANGMNGLFSNQQLGDKLEYAVQKMNERASKSLNQADKGKFSEVKLNFETQSSANTSISESNSASIQRALLSQYGGK